VDGVFKRSWGHRAFRIHHISISYLTMSAPSSIEPHDNEKGQQIDVSTKLAEEVYGAGALTGEVDKFSSWGLRLRKLVGKIGAEEGGIERVPPEARTNQHPRGMNSAMIYSDIRFVLSLHFR
jgi:hypothetical protein